jgi:hypothetical protein
MRVGRPTQADPGTLYVFAHQFYWGFKAIDEGSVRFRHDTVVYGKTKRKIEAMHNIRVPGEPDIIDSFLRATTPKEIATICEDAFSTRRIKIGVGLEKEVQVPNWPISPGSILPSSLSEFAAEFIAAKNDSRFPRSSRRTSRAKQLWFLSRALAGAVQGISTRTAINLIGSRRPDQMVEFSKGRRRTKNTRRKNT